MKNSVKWIIIAVVLVGLIGGSTVLYNTLVKNYDPNNIDTADSSEKMLSSQEMSSEPEETYETEDEPYRLDHFTVLDYNGKEVSLEDFKGKPVVLNFWTSWCPNCVSEMPYFDDAAKNYPNVEFVMINVTVDKRETEEKARTYIENSNFENLNFYFDVNKSSVLACSVYNYPTTYFVNSEGLAVDYCIGSLDYEELVEYIKKIK